MGVHGKVLLVGDPIDAAPRGRPLTLKILALTEGGATIVVL